MGRDTAGDGTPTDDPGIDREKSAARLDCRLLPDQLRLHGGAIFGRPPSPSPSFTRWLHLILFVKIREAIVRLSEGRVGHDCQARFAVSCGIEGRWSPTVHRPHHFTQIPASHFTLLLAFDAAGRERQCSEPFDRNFSAALLAFSVTAALETLERSLDGLEPLFRALRQIHQHIAVQFGTRNVGLVAGYTRSVARLITPELAGALDVSVKFVLQYFLQGDGSAIIIHGFSLRHNSRLVYECICCAGEKRPQMLQANLFGRRAS